MKRRYLFLVFIIFVASCTAQPTLEETAVPPTQPPHIEVRPSDTPIFTTETALLADSTDAVPAVTISPHPQLTAPPIPTPQQPIPTVPPPATNVRRGENEDYNFRQWAGFDGIPPIYEPEFSLAAEAPLQDDELVMGVTLGGEAKAYPITVLQFREMVNDELAGIPILVSW